MFRGSDARACAGQSLSTTKDAGRPGSTPNAAPSATAAEPATLGSIEVRGHYDNGIGTSDAASEGVIRGERLTDLPLLRPGEVLETVPGMVVTQHSGDGKANQYFLRGYNLDHGTDFSTTVDGVPANMPTNAHGQGYSDLNFLIPELAGDVHYKKGPYYADEGDSATAGTARVGLRNEIASSATLGFGEDGYRRGLLMGSAALLGGTLIGAGENYHNDGPFEVPDDYHRLNGVLRYVHGGYHSGDAATLEKELQELLGK